MRANRIGSMDIVEYEEFLTENIICHDRKGNRYVCLVDDEKQFHQLEFCPEEDENESIYDYVYSYKYGYLICRIWKDGLESVSVVDSNMRTCFSTPLFAKGRNPFELTNIVILTRQYMAVKNHIIDMKTGENMMELSLQNEESYNLIFVMNPEKDVFILAYQMPYWLNTYYVYKIDLKKKKILAVKKRENLSGIFPDGDRLFKKISEKRFILFQKEKDSKIVYNSDLEAEGYIYNISQELEFTKADEEKEHICYIDENSELIDVDCKTGEMKKLYIPGYRERWILLDYIDGKMYFLTGKKKIGIFDVHTQEIQEMSFNNKISFTFKRGKSLIVLTVLEVKESYDLETKECKLLKEGIAEYYCIEE